jgi:7-cyano-7-deazaguanine reductase
MSLRRREEIMDPRYDETPLGRQVDQAKSYTPALLCPIPRWDARELLDINPEQLPFNGVDVWNHYEVSWLDGHGKPVVAVAELLVPATSRNIIESKSLKLYFNSLNFKRFEHRTEFIHQVETDLARIAQAPVQLTLHTPESLVNTALGSFGGIDLDSQDLVFDETTAFTLNPLHLQADNGYIVSEELYSHLLRSNCPVTHQPDWASLYIRYRGPAINHTGLLRYIVSYRDHADFHEQCVERIFVDILRHCHPSQLTVYARYTRRGGIDINPFRSNCEDLPANVRLFRQ